MLSLLDWLVIGIYLLLSLIVGIYFSRRAGESTAEFFGGGKNMPWWLGGISLVATTFAADTPLAVTELVRKNGIAGNWLWWNMLLGGMFTTFFFARYWRRSEALTDLELVTIRYSGKEAHFLRGLKAIYFGLFLNTIIIGWVNVAMATVLQIYFGLTAHDALLYVGLCLLLTTLYSSLSGLLGVVYTDAFQFIIAMVGCIILAFLVINSDSIGGVSSLVEKAKDSKVLNFFPDFSANSASSQTGTFRLDWLSFIAFAGVQWWASWYPGAEPGGGGYVAQRILAAKNEKHALASVLLFQILHFAVRPWPWIIVAVASLILYPDLAASQYKEGYILAMRDFLPNGFRGLMIAAFLAAYMSTIATHLNWGTSYIINDFYKPFIKPNKTEKFYVFSARVTTFIILILGFLITTQITKIEQAWQFIVECGAGAGLVLILRWYWWRISAWSEIIAIFAPAFYYAICKLIFVYVDYSSPDSFFQFPNTYLLIVFLTTITWIIGTYLTPATDNNILQRFYQKVKPQGFWKPFEAHSTTPQILSKSPIWVLALCWLFSVCMIYGLLFAMGKVLFGFYSDALLFLILFITGFIGVFILGRKFNVFD